MPMPMSDMPIGISGTAGYANTFFIYKYGGMFGPEFVDTMLGLAWYD